jgi:hypothetical protein
MGHVFADIELSNPRGPDLEPVRVKALADAGALMLCIPEHVALQLKLETESMREVSLADGRSMTVPYVGPIRVRFGKRSAMSARWCWAMRSCWAPCPWKTWTWWYHPAAARSRSIRRARIFPTRA